MHFIELSDGRIVNMDQITTIRSNTVSLQLSMVGVSDFEPIADAEDMKRIFEIVKKHSA